jgi:hypothetical protein
LRIKFFLHITCPDKSAQPHMGMGIFQAKGGLALISFTAAIMILSPRLH